MEENVSLVEAPFEAVRGKFSLDIFTVGDSSLPGGRDRKELCVREMRPLLRGERGGGRRIVSLLCPCVVCAACVILFSRYMDGPPALTSR